jgi:hypothetical protein
LLLQIDFDRSLPAQRRARTKQDRQTRQAPHISFNPPATRKSHVWGAQAPWPAGDRAVAIANFCVDDGFCGEAPKRRRAARVLPRFLHGDRGFDRRVWIVTNQFEVFEFEVVDIFDSRIQFHPWQGPALAR